MGEGINTFTNDSAERIARTVLEWERFSDRRPEPPPPRPPIPGGLPSWSVITDVAIGAAGSGQADILRGDFITRSGEKLQVFWGGPVSLPANTKGVAFPVSDIMPAAGGQSLLYFFMPYCCPDDPGGLPDPTCDNVLEGTLASEAKIFYDAGKVAGGSAQWLWTALESGQDNPRTSDCGFTTIFAEGSTGVAYGLTDITSNAAANTAGVFITLESVDELTAPYDGLASRRMRVASITPGDLTTIPNVGDEIASVTFQGS